MAPRTLIIDTDPGVDDVLAILLALSSPEFDVKLLSIVFGNTHAPSAHANLLKIYHVLQNELKVHPEELKERYPKLGDQGGKTVLAIGADGPVGGEKATAAYFHGKDGLSNLTESHPHFTPPTSDTPDSHPHLELEERPSWEVMLEMLEKEEKGSVVIVALGPLTNLAQALRSNPETFARVGGVVWMGGALDVAGNTSPSAEFNCFADPYAASEIVQASQSGLINLVMAPLDITSTQTIPFTDLIHPSIVSSVSSEGLPIDFPPYPPAGSGGKQWSETPTPLEGFVSAMLLRVRGLQKSFGLPDAMEMHDPVAIWYALCVAGLSDIGVGGASVAGGDEVEGWVLKQREFKVERIGELTRGMCVVDRRGTGESGGEIRTEGEKKKDEREKGRMGEDVVKPKNLPWVLVKSPGKEVLRKVLLERVFGGQI